VVYLRKVGGEGGNCIQIAQDRVQLRAFVIMMLTEILGCHGGEHDDCLLGCCAV
jgi:hypothetical protein